MSQDAYLERKQRLDQEQQAIQNRLHEADQKTSLEQSKQALLAEFEQYCQRIQTNRQILPRSKNRKLFDC